MLSVGRGDAEPSAQRQEVDAHGTGSTQHGGLVKAIQKASLSSSKGQRLRFKAAWVKQINSQ